MLTLNQVTFSYPKGAPVLQDLDLQVARGELLAVMGPSGCGKSTLLLLLAGLLRPTMGSIRSEARKTSFVFQEPRLFPQCTVEENVAAVLSEPPREGLIEELLAEVGLADAKGLYPGELSGGMRMRVSLARALAYGGDLFLLDEPFAALDEARRDELADFLRDYCKKHGVTAVLVSHDREISERFADRILEMQSPRQ